MASIYVHIPFCERKCLYCDFCSVEETGLVEDFLAALRGEISLRADSADRAVFETVFFGGGTPSLLEPRQLDAILLTVEDETPLARLVEAGVVRTNPAGVEAEMYGRAMELLGAHRYAHNEVSNFALPGFRCRHNCNYWSHEDYLGFGPSAHSFWKERDATSGRRWWNVADLSTYQDRLRSGSLAVASEEHVGIRERDPWQRAPFPNPALTGPQASPIFLAFKK